MGTGDYCGAAAFFKYTNHFKKRRYQHEGTLEYGAGDLCGNRRMVGYFLGGCDGLLIALVVFVAVDYITGVMCAVSDKKLSSEVGFKGICRKVLIFLLVGIANIVDVQVIGTGRCFARQSSFFISNEGVSLLENAAHLGLPVPEKMKDILEQLHDRAKTQKARENNHGLYEQFTGILHKNSARTTPGSGRTPSTASRPTVWWGQCSVETLGIFLPVSKQASCNYGIGEDGRIGMYVEEKNRSWCSSSNANDQRAITIESRVRWRLSRMPLRMWSTRS